MVFTGYFVLVLFIYQSYSDQLRDVQEVTEETELQSQKMLLNSEMMELARARTRLTSKIIDTDDVFEKDKLNMQLESYAGRFAMYRSELLKFEMSPQEQAILDTHPPVISVILPAQRQAVSLAMSGDQTQVTLSRKLLYETVLPGQTRLIDSFARLISIEQQTITDLTLQASSSMQSINRRMSQLITTTLALIVIISVIVISRVRTIQRNLIDHRSNLESKVKQRTEELTDLNHTLEESLKEIQDTQERLIESEKLSAVGTLVAGVAHEVNTPIGISITANSQVSEDLETLSQEFATGQMTKSDLQNYIDKTRKSSRILSSNLDRAAELIGSFKQVSADQNMDEVRSFDLCDYLNDIIVSVEPQLKRTPHKIRVHCDKGIIIQSVPGVYSQIITNLIMNSLLHGFDEEYLNLHGKDARGRINIIASLNDDKSRLVIDYHDSGKGMMDEQAKQIFQPFFTTKRDAGGTGLGMFIVYNLVTQKLNGEINCFSQPGEGLQVVIEIPMDKLT